MAITLTLDDIEFVTERGEHVARLFTHSRFDTRDIGKQTVMDATRVERDSR